MKLHFTSGYHPEGDSHTEHTNQTLKQYLRIYCNYQHSNWSDLLPLVEFAYNNAPNATTGVSLFFTNKSYNPNLSVHPERDLVSTRACDFVVDLNKLHQQLRSTISNAQKWYQVSADKHQSPAADFKISDKVFVKAKHFHTTHPLKKLSEKYLGPYDIITQASTHSFTLQLPDSRRSVHPVFHVSILQPSTLNTISNHIQPPLPLVNVDGEPEYEISEILNYQHSNWSDLLPLVEFAYNNAPNATTGVSLFFANKGYNPNLSVHPERDLVSAHARDFVVVRYYTYTQVTTGHNRIITRCYINGGSKWQL